MTAQMEATQAAPCGVQKTQAKTSLTAKEVDTKYLPFWSKAATLLTYDMRKDLDEYNKRLPYAMGANANNPLRVFFNVLNTLCYEACEVLRVNITYTKYNPERYMRETIAIEGEEFDKLISTTADLIRLMECGEQVTTAALDLFTEADCLATEELEEYVAKLETYRDNFQSVANMAYEFAQCLDANN